MTRKDETSYFKRPRLKKLFLEAVNFPLVVVSAGAGFGKTSALLDFLQEYQAVTVWMQLTERDNVGARFWENFTRTVAQVNKPFATELEKMGFPDTKEKVKQYMGLLRDLVEMKQRVIVMDDFHCIEEASVIRFLEECLVLKMPPGTSVVLLTRSSPQHINTAGLVSRSLMFNIGENDLRFTENELAQYFRSMNITPPIEHIHEIMLDTEGWVFAINLIAHSYQKAPGYAGYVRNAVKTSIFRLMETEIWEDMSEKLQNFLIRMSLISHLSFDLITSLAGNNKTLITELEKQNAYVRRDNYINAYVIHPLFLEFLAQKQETLSENQKEETYRLAGDWCNKNGFKVDAISYFEKIGDYKSIAAILYALPSQIPREIAKYASEILDKAPQQAFDTVSFLAIMHISTYLSMGLWEKAVELAEHYEEKYLKMPKTNPFRNDILSGIYYCWGFLRILLCTKDDRYDFDEYFEKSLKFASTSFDIRRSYNRGPGPWINAAGASRKGAPQEFIEALARTTSLYTKHFKGLKTGEEELARGELKFYQGDTRAAETYFISALEQARQFKHFEVLQRTLFYTLRLAVVQGNFQRTEQVLKEMKSHLEENDYINRFINYDITLCWYNCTLGMSDNVPDWLTDGFSPYGHPAFIENFGNQMKALYFYTTRNYPPLLSYINEVRNREAYLYGRIEMLAMEACVHYRMKDKQKAADSLREAYENAAPNEIIMPFIELGKDMRTLTAFMQKKKDSVIPKDWLEMVNLKAASYAKRQAHVATAYKQANSIAGGVAISPRETEILSDLSHGLSRAEIAANRNLSINTVKMVINNIYMKLGAENLADAIRIAAERKIV